MSVVTSLIAANWEVLAGLFAAAAGALGLYLKGRSDARRKSDLEDLTNANAIRKAGADASASVNTSPERLRDDDGWRRD